MSDITIVERRKFERLLGTGGGYVLDFTNNEFEAFIYEKNGIEIYDDKYYGRSGSKASELLEIL